MKEQMGPAGDYHRVERPGRAAAARNHRSILGALRDSGRAPDLLGDCTAVSTRSMQNERCPDDDGIGSGTIPDALLVSSHQRPTPCLIEKLVRSGHITYVHQGC